jgi:hypothetical protein
VWSVYCLGWWLGRLGLNVVEVQEIFLFSKSSSLCPGPAEPSVEWAVSFLGKVTRLCLFDFCPHLVLRLRRSGPTPFLFLYAFVAVTGTILCLLLSVLSCSKYIVSAL